MHLDSEKSPGGNNGYENIYIARQPVFDQHMNLWAYELLYRDRQLATSAVFVDKLQATLKVLAGLPFCLDFADEQSHVIINFPSKAVIDQMQAAYPAQTTMVQLTDSDYSEEGLLEAVKKLTQAGYSFSFDDFEGNPQHDTFCHLANYITIDMLYRGYEKLKNLVTICKNKFPDSILIAKRIEEYDDYLVAKSLGFKYFQGFFFKRPQVHSGRKISSNSLSKLKILQLLQNEDFEFRDMSKVLSTDVSIIHRLLVYINSTSVGLRKKIESVEEALVIMGINPLKKWLQIILLTDIKPVEKPQELVILSAQRAYFLELLAVKHGFNSKKDQFFLLGLFSLIDAILDKPMDALLSQLSLSKQLKGALLRKESEFFSWIKLIEYCENAYWMEVDKISSQLGISTRGMCVLYEEAYHQARNLFTSVAK